MGLLRRLSMRNKLLLLLVIPSTVALFFLGVTLLSSWQSSQTMQRVQLLSGVSVAASNLVHELQKERGLTAAFLGSKGTRLKAELGQQRKLADQRLQAYQQTLASLSLDSLWPAFRDQLAVVDTRIKGLNQLRQKVSGLSIPAKQAIGQYTQGNAEMLQLVSLMAMQAADPQISNRANAYYYFLQGKERAGIERAVLSNTFARDSFGEGMKQRFVTLLAQQDTYSQTFTEFAVPDDAALLTQLVSGRAVDEVNRLRKVALSSDSGFETEAGYWFKMATERINLLKQVEDTLAERLKTKVDQRGAEERTHLIWMLAIAVLASCFNLGLVFAIYWLITRQLNSLSAAMNLVEDSDLSARAELISQDSLGRLAGSFNQMMEKLSSLVYRVRDASGQLVDSVNQVQQVAHDVDTEVQQGLAQTEMVAAAMNEMGASVREVAGSCSEASGKANLANESVGEGRQVSEQAKQSIGTLSSDIDRASGVIERLASNSNEISTVLDVIRGVAEQTNLLALNAAIEAARAGEQGRGFAVVADEVRSLAQKTQQSTEQINAMIDKLQQGSQDAVDVMEQSQACAGTTIGQFEQQSAALEEISTQIVHVNDLNHQVAAATEQQTATVEEINQSINAIQQRYQQTASSASSLGDASSQMQLLAESLQQEVSQFKG
ncbi:methyl-accepting chemotaxis protein [Motiliproteus coralliicola]|nr:methyl-accepting chemotaxis protein [Motiliproteus coralliicola]